MRTDNWETGMKINLKGKLRRKRGNFQEGCVFFCLSEIFRKDKKKSANEKEKKTKNGKLQVREKIRSVFIFF